MFIPPTYHRFAIDCDSNVNFHYFKGKTREEARKRAQLMPELMTHTHYSYTFILDI